MIDLWFVLKGVILTEVLADAIQEWGIFDKPRAWIKARSEWARRLLACHICVSFWCGGFVVLYLSYFEVLLITYVFIFQRLSSFVNVIYLILDWKRANAEEDFMRKVSGKEK